jgi:pyridoxine 4-dehydrogenase
MRWLPFPTASIEDDSSHWIAGARVRRAQALLETTQLAVERVAAESGSGSAALMGQHFAEIVGTTPLDYRRAFSRGGTECDSRCLFVRELSRSVRPWPPRCARGCSLSTVVSRREIGPCLPRLSACERLSPPLTAVVFPAVLGPQLAFSSRVKYRRIFVNPCPRSGTIETVHTFTALGWRNGRREMTKQMLGGSFTLLGTSIGLKRMGYGAMQLAGPQVWGPPRDLNAAIAVLREAVSAGVNHIDTSDYYGPHVTNQIIKQALHPYEKGLVIVTKVGARRLEDKSWVHALSRQELIDAVHDNLRNLGLDVLDLVNLRVGGAMEPSAGSIEEPLTVLTELQRQGLISHIGLSNVTRDQLAQGQTITEILCVQNLYNLARRNDDGFIDELARQGIAYVPFFPLGGFTPLQSAALDRAAATIGATPMQLALAWLLQRAPNILLIPGTSSVKHLHENLDAATLHLSPETISDLDSLWR